MLSAVGTHAKNLKTCPVVYLHTQYLTAHIYMCMYMYM